MPSLQELIAQRSEIEKQIADAQREERSSAISRIRTLMSEHGLSTADVSGRAASTRSGAARSSSKVAPKYRNAATGDTWSGRGLQPKWLRAALSSGGNLDDFTI